MDKKSLIDIAIKGGLLLYDDKSLKMKDKSDWLIFFDMTRDNPTPYTEKIIESILKGLCPQKNLYYPSRNVSYFTTFDPEKPKPFWYFPVGKEISSKFLCDFPSLQATEYFIRNYNVILNSQKTKNKLDLSHARSHGELIYAFKTMPEAWEFLFNFMIK